MLILFTFSPFTFSASFFQAGCFVFAGMVPFSQFVSIMDATSGKDFGSCRLVLQSPRSRIALMVVCCNNGSFVTFPALTHIFLRS